MKKNVRFGFNAGLPVTITLILLFFAASLNFLQAQVSFKQTSDYDFNSGLIHSGNVSGDNLYLQTAASSPNNWLTTTTLPQSLSGHKTITWNNRYVYLVGGQTTSGYSNGIYYASFSSSGINGWSGLNALPVALKDAAVVIGINTIYVIGGRNATQIFNTIYYASINYDGTIGAWQTSYVTLPGALWGHTAAFVNGYIYVAGGSSSTTENTAVNSVYYAKVKLDNTISAFSNGANLPAQRNKHSMVTYDNKLYVLGGYNGTGVRSNTVYFATPGLDGNPGAWSSGTPLPVTISNHSAVLTNGLIMILAGATNAGLTNTIYYASIDQPLPWTWTTSPYMMYDITKDGSAFAGNGLVIHTGGSNLSGAPILNSRYTSLNMTGNYVNHTTFVSQPFTQLGADRIIDSLSFHASFDPAFANCQITYRTAHADGNWTNWNTLSASTPVLVGDTTQFLQYAVTLTGQSTYNSVFHDLTLSTRGTQLSGNLNWKSNFTAAESPYWVTSDISFTGGTHTFEAGATILFLPYTGMYVGQANILCAGTANDSVRFQYYANGIGMWKGIRFQPNSDEYVSSQFNYTVIQDAGYENNANLLCDQTNEPYLANCNIRKSSGYGIYLYHSNINVQTTVIKENNSHGVHLYNSSPTLIASAISFNGAAGVNLNATSSNPTYSSTTIDHNLYGIHYEHPNCSFTEPLGSPTLTENTYNGIAIEGGDITGTNQIWNTISYEYILLGTIRIVQNWSYIRLTIEPGNIIKALPGVQLQVGGYNPCCGDMQGGELYAMGTPDKKITFTSHNGLDGGWNGIYFRDGSDYGGGHSQLDYCIIEKGSDYNFFAERTIQPDLVNHSIIRNALVDGARYSNSSGLITNCEFSNNGRYPLYLLDVGADPNYANNMYTANGNNRIAISARDYNYSKSLMNPGIPYHVLGNIRVFQHYQNGQPALTIAPGTTLEFEQNTKLIIATNECWCYQGRLIANGKPDSIITFKPYNDSIGGWGGISFYDGSDNWGGTSSMKYCKVEKSSNYNLYCESSNQPTIENCEFSESGGSSLQLNSSSPVVSSCLIHGSGLDGITLWNSSSAIHGCQFQNNGRYPLYLADGNANPDFSGNLYSNNVNNRIGYAGRDFNTSRSLINPGIPYHILGNLRVFQHYQNGLPALIITPGTTLEFEQNAKLVISTNDCWCYQGMLIANGKPDSIITFKPYNDSIGGWGGISFYDGSDNWGGTSSMKYCIVEKASDYNLYVESSNQPTIKHCEFSQSGGSNILLGNSSPVVDSCIIHNSGLDGIHLWNSTSFIQGCQFLNNGRYPLCLADGNANPDFANNIYSGNSNNRIGLSSRNITYNKSLVNPGIPYHVLGDLNVFQYYWEGLPTLTIKPGVILDFASGARLRIAPDHSQRQGQLHAIGTSDSLIVFKPFNDSIGGWGGISLYDGNDNWGGISTMKYCKIEKASNYNLYCESSNQPKIEHCEFSESGGSSIQLGSSSPTIDSCFIHNSGGDGITLWSSSPAIHHCQIVNNGNYPLYMVDANANPDYSNNVYSGNGNNRIALSSRNYTYDKVLSNPGIPYHVLGDLNIFRYQWEGFPTLTINPGVILEFSKGTRLRVAPDDYWRQGRLFAIGKPDSTIIFKPYNDSIGGWDGIVFYDGNDNWGGTSYMKYCTVEKAAQYNLLCYSSNMPVIENCRFTQSALDGIGLSNSPLIIRSTSITDNLHYGLYNEGSSSPSIGNIPLFSCNIYNNGSYNIYNYSNYDLYARYNFWASRDSVKIKSKIWDKDDNPSLGRVFIQPFIDLPALHTDSMTVEGDLKYANNYLTPMNNTRMKLKNIGVTIDSTNTISSGWYGFDPVASGCYNLTSTPAQNWAGVNATDALLILNHTVHISMLTGMKLAAADMNKSNTVNSTDALFAMNRFTGNITSFPSGDTFMEIDTIIVDSSHVTNNLKMLWFGDVNASYVPVGKSHEATVTLADGGFITVPSFTEFSLPVRIKRGEEIGAISFGLYIPTEFFEVVSVTMNENRENIHWTSKDGLFRFAWSDLKPINPDDQEVLVTIKMRSFELSGLQDNFTFGLYEECEIANKAVQVIPDVELEIPGIRSNAYGIEDPENRFSLSVHPNPFKEQTTIDLKVTAESSISYTLCDLFGKAVRTLNPLNLEPGTHHLILQRDNLSPGIYLLKVNIASSGKLSSRIIKVVVSK